MHCRSSLAGGSGWEGGRYSTGTRWEDNFLHKRALLTGKKGRELNRRELFDWEKSELTKLQLYGCTLGIYCS